MVNPRMDAPVHRRLHELVKDLLDGDAGVGEIRDDIRTGELATFCLHALDAAPMLPSQVTAQRPVIVVLAGLGVSD